MSDLSMLGSAALALANQGWPVFPCAPPHDSSPQRGKRPLSPHGFKDATVDEATIREWWTRWPDANIGMATGVRSGIVVVDIDPRNDGWAGLSEVPGARELCERTVCVETGGGGRHAYFALPAGLVLKLPKTLARGVDLKGDGGYVIVPPSVHASGREYVWGFALSPPVGTTEYAPFPMEWASEDEATVEAAGAIRRSSERSGTVAEAVDRYNAANAGAWPARPGTCPICNHNGCFKALKDVPGKWICYSTGHPDEAGRPNRSGQTWGDALDIDAYNAGRRGLDGRLDHLRATGYLEPIRQDPPREHHTTEDVPDEVLAARAADECAAANTTGERWRDAVADAAPAVEPIEEQDPDECAWDAMGAHGSAATTPPDASESVQDVPRCPNTSQYVPPATTPHEIGPISSGSFSDAGNAILFAELQGDDLLYVRDMERWLRWRESRWSKANDAEMIGLALSVPIARWQAARAIHVSPDDKDAETRRAAAMAWASKCESSARLRSLLDLAPGQASIATTSAELDQHPWLLSCANGVVDLRDGTMGPHDRTLKLTKASSVAYEPTAKCPTWERFLDDVFLGDGELIGFVQRAIGYTLTGQTTEQKFFVCYESGSNGKSTFLNVLRDLLGDYAGSIQFDTLAASKRDPGAPAPDLAKLRGLRLVTSLEAEEGARFGEALVKQLTGSDPISARDLHESPVTFIPQFKLWLAANHKPVIRGTDRGIWRRPILIPFRATFSNDPVPRGQSEATFRSVDPHIGAKLSREMPGILNWAVEGAVAWRAMGLGECAVTREATLEYRAECDVIGMFLDACCEDMAGAWTASSRMYERYCEWAKSQGEYVLSAKRLTQSLVERGYKVARSNSNRGIVGIALKTDG